MNKYLVFTACYDDELALVAVFDSFSQAKVYVENWMSCVEISAARHEIIEICPDNSFETLEVS